MSSIDLATVLDDLAHAVAEHGTTSHRAELTYLAEAGSIDAPAAAETLVDWSAPEILRQRAFGVVHAALARRMRAEHSLAAATRHVAVLYRLAA